MVDQCSHVPHAFSNVHTIWWLATITETYTLNVALLTGELLFLISLIRSPRWQTATGLFFSMDFDWSVHNLALMFNLPIYGSVLIFLLATKRLPFKTLSIAVCAFILGGSLYLTLIINAAIKNGDMVTTLQEALFGKFAAEVLGSVKRDGIFLRSILLCHP